MFVALHAEALSIPPDLVAAAARCWRSARDGGTRIQQHLYALLSPQGGEMLVPVFDSLMTLYECALGRRLVPGKDGALSTDEHRLLDLLDGTGPSSACIDCPESAACALDCAICSTRVMIALTIRESPAALPPRP